MRRLSCFHLSWILAGMAVSGISWSHDRGYSRGYYGHSHNHYSGKRNVSLGIGLAGSYNYYPASNIGIYGSYSYERPYPYYRQPYYQSYNYAYPPSRYYYSPVYPSVIYPPVVVVPPNPPVYIQQQPVRPVSPPESTPTNYWYYCENPAGYYPQVERCPGGWIKVPPRPAQ
ncbi:hypothetical protein FBR06_03665 [Betaproteobacteria bacterium PRO4]|nr:hypothetical protein [Betaproteobacteria bacterium PRO4]